MLAAGAILPFLPGHAGLPCPLRTLTGVPCPMCGMTTSVEATLHGHPGSALGANPAGPALVLCAVAILLRRPKRLLQAPLGLANIPVRGDVALRAQSLPRYSKRSQTSATCTHRPRRQQTATSATRGPRAEARSAARCGAHRRRPRRRIAFVIEVAIHNALGTILGYALGIGYYGWLEGSTSGQTIGKKAMGIRVYDLRQGGPIGTGRAIGRYFARILSAIPCLSGTSGCSGMARNRPGTTSSSARSLSRSRRIRSRAGRTKGYATSVAQSPYSDV